MACGNSMMISREKGAYLMMKIVRLDFFCKFLILVVSKLSNKYSGWQKTEFSAQRQ